MREILPFTLMIEELVKAGVRLEFVEICEG
jgi:hypothetical protein